MHEEDRRPTQRCLSFDTALRSSSRRGALLCAALLPTLLAAAAFGFGGRLTGGIRGALRLQPQSMSRSCRSCLLVERPSYFSNPMVSVMHGKAEILSTTEHSARSIVNSEGLTLAKLPASGSAHASEHKNACSSAPV